MIRIVLGILVLVFGFFAVLFHNKFRFALISPSEFVVMGICLVLALFLFFGKKKGQNKQPQGIHTMTFCLENLNPAQMGISLKEGQQLYLLPYTGSQEEQISVTDEKGTVLGFVPEENQDYVLSRIESHSLTHTVIEKLEQKPLGLCSAQIRITC